MGKICGVNVLPNGNLVLGIYAAKQSENGGFLFEVTRDKKSRLALLQNRRRPLYDVRTELDSSGKAVLDVRQTSFEPIFRLNFQVLHI